MNSLITTRAQCGDRVRHHALDLGAHGHVAGPGDQAGDLLGDGVERFGVDVADEHFGAGCRKGARIRGRCRRRRR